MHEVRNGRPLLEELGVGHHRERHDGFALAQGLTDLLAHAVCRAHGHRALVDHHFVVLHVASDRARHLQHVRQIGRAILGCRRAHGDEDDGAVDGGLRRIGGELQTPGRGIACHQVRQAGLVNGDATLPQHLDP